MTTTLEKSRTLTSANAIDRTQPNSNFLPLGKVVQLRVTSHLEQGGILSSSTTALSLEETIELIAQLSSALEKATTFTE